MNSPVAAGGAAESFFSPGQAERGQAGAGRAATAGVTAGACPGCAGGAGSQADAGRGPCAGGACQGCDPLQEQDPWTNWTGNRNTVQPDLVNQGTAQSFQNQGMVFPPGVGVPVPPSSCSHGSGSGGGSVGASAWNVCATHACLWLRSTKNWDGCCESDIADDESKTREYEKSDGRE